MLSSFHTMFARLHNIIAENLKEQLPDLDEEDIFWEARQINIGFYQNIIYNEYIPQLIGVENFLKVRHGRLFPTLPGNLIECDPLFNEASDIY